MPDPTLVVLAGGIGSRYGGLKQADPIGPNGELIIHYSVYDALRAGFGRIVFLIRRDIEETFRERIGRTVEQHADVRYVYQDLDKLPAGFSVPGGRSKPWGTAHAVLCCREVVQTNFAAINADDFYGASAYRTLASYLGSLEDRYLQSIRELTHLAPSPAGIRYQDTDGIWQPLAPDSIVSMNIWGFTPAFFGELERLFPAFLKSHAADLSKAEFYLPEAVGTLVREGTSRVRVLPTEERWFGVTYQADRPHVQEAIRQLIAEGTYPRRLWAD
jgi:NDP-sugar pyrophosphorylase family protein